MPETTNTLPVKNLEAVLRESLDQVPQLQNTTWKYLTDPGENFGSLILAVDTDIIHENSVKKFHLVAKMPPTSAYLLDLFNSPATFRKELYFYRSVAPQFLEIQKENGSSENELIKLVPQFYGGRMGLKDPDVFDEQALILLENLNFSGYKTQDRIAGLDKEHMVYAVKELAKLHAIPIALRIKKPRIFEEIILPGLKSHFSDVSTSCVVDMINKAKSNLKNMELGMKLEEKIENTIQHAFNEKISNADTLSGPWLSLVHCDFWVNNMMFRYDEKGHISGMKIVDFQLCLYDYCVDDLIFFLLSSARREIIDNHLNELIDLYYESFISCLRSLNVDTAEFTRESFDQILLERAPVKFPQCIMMVQVIKATRGSAPDVQSIDKKEKFLDIGKGQLYNEKLLHILDVFHKKGWLKT